MISIRFFGDLILSHAATSTSGMRSNSILLWKIDGFNSEDTVPLDPPIPMPGVATRSAFGGKFQRLLTFDMPNTVPFYMRFSLFDAAGQRPILVMGNTKSRFSFWDLQALEEDHVVGDYKPATSGRGRPRKKNLAFDSRRSVSRLSVESPGGSSLASPALTTTSLGIPDVLSPGPGPDDASQSQAHMSTDPRYDISDPMRPLLPHHTLTVPKYNFTTRQIAWSNCGKWCVAVGEIGIMCLFHRP